MGQKVSIAQVAAEVGVHERTIRRYISAGRLTAYRVGPHLIRVDLDDARTQLLGSPLDPKDCAE